MAGHTSESLFGANLGSDDAWLAHFDGSGTLLSAKQFGTGSSDDVFGAVADGVGGVYLGGGTAGSLAAPNSGSSDVWFARYERTGTQVWAHQFGSTGPDYHRGLAFTGSGTICAGGFTLGDLAATNKGVTDAWISRIAENCNATSYCTSSTTSIPDCNASISSTGIPTASSPDAFMFTSGSIPGGNLGICFFNSTGTASTPFGTLGGMICMQGPIYRSAPKPSGGSSGSCNGSYTFRLTDLIAASPIVTSGATLHAQVWARDPANQDGFLLSDGLEVVVCP